MPTLLALADLSATLGPTLADAVPSLVLTLADAANEVGLGEVADQASEAQHGGGINWSRTISFLLLALVLIILNGFFVAAEFALVKVKFSRIEKARDEGKMFAGTSVWLAERLDKSLSACQLGITMASLALGWVGEPAFAVLVGPVMEWFGVTDPNIVHIVAFAVSFGVITGLHLVVGEQFPKIFAIRRPLTMLLWCALPLRFFYYLLYPFLTVLDAVTAALLRLVGIEGASEHGDGPSSEEEIRHLLSEAHIHGNLTRSEHRLIQNVFEFDDMTVGSIMLPRTDVEFFDVGDSPEDHLALFGRTKHTRYPVADRSLDSVLGVAHVKDLLRAGYGRDSEVAGAPETKITDLMRPPMKLPETLPISRVLRQFQSSHQLMAFVVDEHGIILGIVTLEDVLEQIIGAVEDEFDAEEPSILSAGPNEYVIDGGVHLGKIDRELNVSLNEGSSADTVSGLLMERQQKIPAAGDIVEFDGLKAEVIETKNDRATKVRMTLAEPDEAGDELPQSVSKAELAADDALIRGDGDGD